MLSTIKNTIMAGIYISIGAIIYLAIPNKIIGACFFSVGIFLVINYHNMLATKVIPTYFAKMEYKAKDIAIAVIGNSIGCFIIAILISLSRLYLSIDESLKKIVEIKLEDGIISLIVMGFFCGVLVAYASLTSKKYENGSFAQIFYTGIFIASFVVCGFDHVIANVLYFSLYGIMHNFSIGMIWNLIFVLIGNILGGGLVGIIERENVKLK